MRRVLLIVAAGACLLAPATVLLEVLLEPLRVSATLILFCLGPGAAVLPLLAPRRQSAELGLVLATSLAVVTVLGLVMLLLRAWAPGVMTFLLAAACLPAVAAQLRTRT
ncbi:MAG: hypothetical protein M3O90_07205 [Actinomycetota bacterium]|jgi:hypothetical protein|nr:hypothetical protein [Actinomycetota bacterium]